MTLDEKIARLKKSRTAIGIECGDVWVDALEVIHEQQARNDALLAIQAAIIAEIVEKLSDEKVIQLDEEWEHRWNDAIDKAIEIIRKLGGGE